MLTRSKETFFSNIWFGLELLQEVMRLQVLGKKGLPTTQNGSIYSLTLHRAKLSMRFCLITFLLHVALFWYSLSLFHTPLILNTVQILILDLITKFWSLVFCSYKIKSAAISYLFNLIWSKPLQTVFNEGNICQGEKDTRHFYRYWPKILYIEKVFHLRNGSPTITKTCNLLKAEIYWEKKTSRRFQTFGWAILYSQWPSSLTMRPTLSHSIFLCHAKSYLEPMWLSHIKRIPEDCVPGPNIPPVWKDVSKNIIDKAEHVKWSFK